jgi:hypothetical protein
VLANFDQLRHRLRLHGAQADQEGFVLRGFPAHQHMHHHIAAGVGLQRAITLDAIPRQKFDQIVFFREVHVPSHPFVHHATFPARSPAQTAMCVASQFRRKSPGERLPGGSTKIQSG